MNRLFNLARNSNDDDEDDFGSVNSSFASQGAGEVAPEEVIDEDQETGQEATGQEAAPVVEANRMVNYDSQTGDDGDSALEKACHNLKGYEFEQNDLHFYFNQIELRMRTSGVKKNYTKFLVLTSILPPKIRDQVKNILRKQETDFENQLPYKILKDKIIDIFKPNQEADFERAMSRVLTESPSELARALVNDLCKHELAGCCCSTFIVGQWKRHLPSAVKQAIAAIEFNAENFDNIISLADKVYFSNRTQAVPSVSAMSISGAVSLPGPPVLDQAFHPDFPGQQQQVAAMSWGRGRGQFGRGRGRGGRGRGANNGQNQTNQNRPGKSQGQGQ